MVPKPLARWYRTEARLRDIYSRDILVAWVVDEAARQNTEFGVDFDFPKEIDESPDKITRVTTYLTPEGMYWVEAQGIAERASRNAVLTTVLTQGQRAILDRKPAECGFWPSERRLWEIDRILGNVVRERPLKRRRRPRNFEET